MSRSPLADPDLVQIARERSESHPRTLRKIRDLGYRDMTVFEDRSSGERRRVPKKFILALGPPAAFELTDMMEEPHGP